MGDQALIVISVSARCSAAPTAHPPANASTNGLPGERSGCRSRIVGTKFIFTGCARSACTASGCGCHLTRQAKATTTNTALATQTNPCLTAAGQ